MRTTTIHVAIAAAIATVATFCAMAAETGNGLGQKTGEPQSGLRHLKVCRANGGGQPVVDAAPPATNGAFRIMSYNVRFGKGMDGVRDYRRTARCILSEGPDYVCVQEIWNWKEFRRLAGYLGMHGTFANSRHFLGNAVFSREKPIKCEAVELPYSKKMGRTLVICEYKDFVVASMHFDLDVNKRKESVRVVQKALEKYSKPVFIAGDWNNFPKSPVLKGLKKFVKVVSPEKNVHTYHLRTMKRKEAVIDYIAIDKTHAKDFSVLRSYEVPDRKTSDHSPIVVELKPAEKDALTSDASSGTGFALGAVLAYDTLISHRGESVDAPENGAPPEPVENIISTTREMGADGVDLRFVRDVTTAEYMKAIKDAGLELHAWTIDDLADTLEAFRRGAQTVTTNCANKQLDEYRKAAK